MSNTPLASIHDNFLLGYEVDAARREITLRTEFCERDPSELTNVIFSGVEAYEFKNDSLGTILFGIEEVDPATLLEEQWSRIEAGNKLAGWPGPWATSIENAMAYIAEKRSRAFQVESSIGMNGWVLARTMELIRTK